MLCFLETGKNRRLKQAKEEAQAEIEQYRLQREKEFKAKEAAVGLLDHSLLPIQPFSPETASICPENHPQGGTRGLLPQLSSSDAQPRVVETLVEVNQRGTLCPESQSYSG